MTIPAPSSSLSNGSLRVDLESFQYSSRSPKVLNDVHLVAHPGSILGVRGPNGSGKSTLLRVALGIHPYLRAGEVIGAVTYCGRPLGSGADAAANGFCYVGQNPDGSVLGTTVRDELLLDTWTRSVGSSRNTKAAVDSIVDEFDVSRLLGRRIVRLSQGEKQRVVLAAALIRNSRVLALDEPSAMLDASAVATLKHLLRRTVATRRLIAIVTSHDEEFMRSVCDEEHVLPSPTVTRDDVPSVPQIDAELACLPPPATGYRNTMLSLTDVVAGTGTNFRVGPITRRLIHGTILWVKGSNGSGKSTLLRTIAGIQKPLAGKISFAGVSNGTHSGRMLCIQHPDRQIIGCSIEQELRLSQYSQPLADRHAEFGLHMWNRVGAHDAALDSDPRRLSFGQKRVLTILSAGAYAPVILFDEPTNGLDRAHLRWLRNYLTALAENGRIVIFTSHDSKFAEGLATEDITLGDAEETLEE